MNQEKSLLHRRVPRFPLPKEKIKFFLEESEKIFAVRDLSLGGLSISLLEHGESLLFVPNEMYKAELKINEKPILLELSVVRISAWAVGFAIENLAEADREHFVEFLDPIQIGRSLRSVDSKVAPELVGEGISRWYHGDIGTDIFFWNDARGGVERALFCLGDEFWEWTQNEAPRTGTLERLEKEQAKFHYHGMPEMRLKQRVSMILANADVLDYRLVNFLKELNR